MKILGGVPEIVRDIRAKADEIKAKANSFGDVLRGIEETLEDWGVPFEYYDTQTESYYAWKRNTVRMRICFKANIEGEHWRNLEEMGVAMKISSETYQALRRFLEAWKEDLGCEE